MTIASRDATARAAATTVQMYFNYLYLSILFGKPTATHNYERYCVDEPESWNEIAQIAGGSGQDFWQPKCLPVDVTLSAVDPNAKMMVWNAQVRFVEFPGSAEFLARIRQSIASPEPIEFPLVDERRGLELSKSYGFNINFFAQYRQREYVKGVLLAELRNLGSEFDLTQGSGKVRELLIRHKR